MANIHLSYSEFKARFGDLGVTEWVKYNWLSDYRPGPESYLVDFDTIPANVTAVGDGEYEVGDTVQVIITPESGYRWGDDNAPKANGVSMDHVDNTYLYEFEMPAENVTIVFTDVDVELITYDVTVTPIAHCTIAGAGTYAPGTTVTVQLSVNSGYRWASGNAPKIDGNTMTQTGNFFMYSFTMPSENVNIVITDVAVELDNYQVTIDSIPTGTFVIGAGTHTAGSNVIIYLAPDTGYQWGTGNAPKANGVLMTQSGSRFTYNFTMPSQNVLITFTDVVTELQQYAIFIQPVTNTVITGGGYHDYGSTVTVTITPASGYEWGTGNAPVLDFGEGLISMIASGNSFVCNFSQPAYNTQGYITGVVVQEIIPIYDYTWSEKSASTIPSGETGEICQDDNYFYYANGYYIARIPKNSLDISSISRVYCGSYMRNPSVGVLDDNNSYVCAPQDSNYFYLINTNNWSSSGRTQITGQQYMYSYYGNHEFRLHKPNQSSGLGLNCLSVKYDTNTSSFVTNQIDIVANDTSLTEAEKAAMRTNCEILGMYYDSTQSAFDGWSYLLHDYVNQELYWYGAYNSETKISATNSDIYNGNRRFNNFEGYNNFKGACLYYIYGSGYTTYVWTFSEGEAILETLQTYTSLISPKALPFKWNIGGDGIGVVSGDRINQKLLVGQFDSFTTDISTSGTYPRTIGIDTATGNALVITYDEHLIIGTAQRIN